MPPSALPVYCGLDFGTSNSTLGIADAMGARLLALEGESTTLPSAVFIEVDHAPPRFGRAALAAYLDGEDGRLMRGLKSTLGSGLINERTAIGSRAVSFRDVLSRFIGHLRAQLDATTPGLTAATLGRPVHFVDDDLVADQAAEDALAAIAREHGFTDIAFQYEPVAAALDYEQTLTEERLVMVFDIGGGTSDISVIRLGPAPSRRPERSGDILANGGIRVGGTDFDRLLSLAEAMPHLGFGSTLKGGALTMPRHLYLDLAIWHRINALYSARTAADLKGLRADADRPELIDRLIRLVTDRNGHALAIEVERAKITLSDADAARLTLAPLTGGPNPMATRDRFEQAVEAPVARIRALISSTLAQAGVTPDRIGTVFMTGGSSGLPILRRMVAEALPGIPIATGDMLGSVGTGLALDARRRFG